MASTTAGRAPWSASSSDEPDFRINIGVGVSYQSDLDHVRTVLEEVARKFHDKKSHSEPHVFLSEFGDSSVVFDVAVWTRDAWGVRKLRSRVRHAIWDAFKAGDIVIAFPQLDVHFDEGTRLAGRGPRVAPRRNLSTAPDPRSLGSPSGSERDAADVAGNGRKRRIIGAVPAHLLDFHVLARMTAYVGAEERRGVAVLRAVYELEV